MIEVTKEMEDAGIAVLDDLQGQVSNAMIAREVYRAMRELVGPQAPSDVHIRTGPSFDPEKFKAECMAVLNRSFYQASRRNFLAFR
jgi:hypothetical protein